VTIPTDATHSTLCTFLSNASSNTNIFSPTPRAITSQNDDHNQPTSRSGDSVLRFRSPPSVSIYLPGETSQSSPPSPTPSNNRYSKVRQKADVEKLHEKTLQPKESLSEKRMSKFMEEIDEVQKAYERERREQVEMMRTRHAVEHDFGRFEGYRTRIRNNTMRSFNSYPTHVSRSHSTLKLKPTTHRRTPSTLSQKQLEAIVKNSLSISRSFSSTLSDSYLNESSFLELNTPEVDASEWQKGQSSPDSLPGGIDPQCSNTSKTKARSTPKVFQPLKFRQRSPYPKRIQQRRFSMAETDINRPGSTPKDTSPANSTRSGEQQPANSEGRNRRARRIGFSNLANASGNLRRLYLAKVLERREKAKETMDEDQPIVEDEWLDCENYVQVERNLKKAKRVLGINDNKTLQFHSNTTEIRINPHLGFDLIDCTRPPLPLPSKSSFLQHRVKRSLAVLPRALTFVKKSLLVNRFSNPVHLPVTDPIFARPSFMFSCDDLMRTEQENVERDDSTISYGTLQLDASRPGYGPMSSTPSRANKFHNHNKEKEIHAGKEVLRFQDHPFRQNRSNSVSTYYSILQKGVHFPPMRKKISQTSAQKYAERVRESMDTYREGDFLGTWDGSRTRNCRTSVGAEESTEVLAESVIQHPYGFVRE
jgi:hypothetical protein